jgi:hypothetical protein
LFGTIKQNRRDYLLSLLTPDEVLVTSEGARKHGLPEIGREKSGATPVDSFETLLPAGHKGNAIARSSNPNPPPHGDDKSIRDRQDHRSSVGGSVPMRDSPLKIH